VEAELALATVTDKVELMQQGSGETRAIERVLSCDDLDDYDEDGDAEEEESPRHDTRSKGFTTRKETKPSFIGINLNTKKNNKSADTTLVVERNRLYGNADAKLISPFAKPPASLGTSNSYTNDSPTSPSKTSSSSSSSTTPREKRKSIGIGNALLGPRSKDRERSGSSPRDKDAGGKAEQKKEKKEHNKKEKKEHKQREKKSKEKEGADQHVVVNPLLSHSGTFSTHVPPS
jgi:hypothetical protein